MEIPHYNTEVRAGLEPALEADAAVRNREATFLVLILLVTGLALWIDFTPANPDGVRSWLGRNVNTRLGLDLQGGTQVLLQAQDPNVTRDVMQTAAGVIERRVNGLGVSEAIVQLSGKDRIIVELPGISNPDQAIENLRSTGRLEFVDPNGAQLSPGQVIRTTGNPNPAALSQTPTPASTTGPTITSAPSGTATSNGTVAPGTAAAGTAAATASAGTASPNSTATASATSTVSSTKALTSTTTAPSGPIYTSITSGSDLDPASVHPRYGGNQTPGGSQYAVSFAFKGASATRLADFTSKNIGKDMCIVLDNRVFSCPNIKGALPDGSGVIETNTRQDADNIYNQLKYGALPISLTIESSQTVSATLGQDSVKASIIAGIVGLVIVALFMLLYYRLPGLVATIALLIYTAITFAFYKLIPITLTLAGIAGFILSIGLAVDANVLIFARLKEELRKGKSLRAAVEAGFDEAWPAIRDSNASTLITSIILFIFGNSFGVSIVKGFALTLGLGIIVSLFTAITVTRTLLRLIVPFQIAQNPWMFELEAAPGLEGGRPSYDM